MTILPHTGQLLHEAFPNVHRFLRFRMPLTPLDDRGVWKTFLQHGQLSAQAGRQAVSWGRLPYLEIESLPKGVYGLFTPGQPDTIAIARRVAERFEADFANGARRQKALFYLRAILLHELVHWGDWRADGVQSDRGRAHEDDAGRRFEQAAYSRKIYPKEWVGDY